MRPKKGRTETDSLPAPEPLLLSLHLLEGPVQEAGQAWLCWAWHSWDWRSLPPAGTGTCDLFLGPSKGIFEYKELKPKVTGLERTYPSRVHQRTPAEPEGPAKLCLAAGTSPALELRTHHSSLKDGCEGHFCRSRAALSNGRKFESLSQDCFPWQL